MRRRSYIALLLIALPAPAQNRQASISPNIDSFALAQTLSGQPILAASKKARSGKHSQAGKLAPILSAGPVVNVITPSQLAPGSVNVPLSITGSFFTPSTTVSFDSAIVPQGSCSLLTPQSLRLW